MVILIVSFQELKRAAYLEDVASARFLSLNAPRDQQQTEDTTTGNRRSVAPTGMVGCTFKLLILIRLCFSVLDYFGKALIPLFGFSSYLIIAVLINSILCELQL